jgi:hypothetical protein
VVHDHADAPAVRLNDGAPLFFGQSFNEFGQHMCALFDALRQYFCSFAHCFSFVAVDPR